jgi:hypothetical protein
VCEESSSTTVLEDGKMMRQVPVMRLRPLPLQSQRTGKRWLPPLKVQQAELEE